MTPAARNLVGLPWERHDRCLFSFYFFFSPLIVPTAAPFQPRH